MSKQSLSWLIVTFNLISICLPNIIRADDFPYELSTFTTSIKDSSQARVNNIRLSLTSLNGKIISPGETFSFLESVGEMKAELGYQDAPVLRDGKKIIDTGGGVCQVATTLYNSALLGGLKIKERHPHSTIINYVPLGRDATVSFVEWKDLKFINTYSFPLMIKAQVEGKRIVIGLFSQKDIRKEIRLITEEGISEFVDNRDNQRPSKVMTWRVVSKDGIEISRELISLDDY